ncbi:UNVERIFIED_CONTAM: Retrovirus-related Pol polyprotein from transposon gypsy [Sesamum angustifolium]|uniref:Retrovirus-related Pol polyprotein from transposon gypsy n=1 Tax=Sesamum angustifolium TaxID=2727405 RepID=A0AAW2IWC7_9LAMI
MHPYRYSFAQKDEIEKIVKELLESGVIQPSQRSFGSLILLIKMWQEDIPKTSFVTHQGHNDKTWEEHLQQLQLTLEVLRKNQLFAKRSKCDFDKQSVEYLGHVISVNGDSAIAAFEQLKAAMVSAPVLALLDFAKPFVVETDACDKGIDSVLMQDHRPIAHLSKVLGPKNQGLSVYEKEFLAILLVVTKWKHYLVGNHFVIKTDQQSVKKGCENKVADALSRRANPECAAVTIVIPNWVTDIVRSYDGDDEFLPVIQAKSIDDAAYPMFSQQGGILRKEGRICVGKSTNVKQRIVRVLHDSSICGHSGINGTYQRVRSMFFWGKLKEDVV